MSSLATDFLLGTHHHMITILEPTLVQVREELWGFYELELLESADGTDKLSHREQAAAAGTLQFQDITSKEKAIFEEQELRLDNVKLQLEQVGDFELSKNAGTVEQGYWTFRQTIILSHQVSLYPLHPPGTFSSTHLPINQEH
ncbi:MAG: hypothetical protein M1839_002254 [Geoglossum umbratile]|nr:MAG: hypothetical protein M1839_002254 [Geoglossum umbratile]